MPLKRAHLILSILSVLGSLSPAASAAPPKPASTEPSKSGSDPAQFAACAQAFDASERLRVKGKFVEAMDQLLICSQPTCQPLLVRECTASFESVKESAPTVTLVARGGEHQEFLVDVKVSVDGKELTKRIEGLAITLDPGFHEFVFEHEGDQAVSLTLLLLQGEKNKVVQAVFKGAEPEPGPKPTPQPIAAPKPVIAQHRASGVPTASYVLGALGLAGLGVGATFRMIASADYDKLGPECGHTCSQSRVDSVKSKYNISTIGFATGGGALLAAGVVYLISRGSSSSSQVGSAPRLFLAPGFSETSAAATLIGSF